MKKFIKGMLIAAGVFCAAGILLGIVGAVIAATTGQSLIYRDGDMTEVSEVWNNIRRWGPRWNWGGSRRGLTLDYDGIDFDEGYNVTYGSFTDDSLDGTDIRNLDLEIGGGKLTIREGDSLVLKKEGGPECQYYIEGDTFYLKQKCPIAGRTADLTLTLPEGILFEEVEVSMGAGEITTKDLLTARNMDIDIDAGEITMAEVKADDFSASVAAGSVTVRRLDAIECDTSVDMGSIVLKDSLVTGNLEAEVNMGDISISLRDSYENHDYKVDCAMGTIQIKPEDGMKREFSGFSNDMEFSGRNADGSSLYDLSCDMGSIMVSFGGAENTAETADGGQPENKTAGLPEAPEVPEVPEVADLPEAPDPPEVPGLPGVPEFIVDNWPESIGRENERTTADNFSFEIPIQEPMTLVISCETKRGELDLEIEDERGREIFERDEIPTGEYEVKIKDPGTYSVSFEMEDHTGSFWIRPKK